MNIAVVGATGATGRLLVRELLARSCAVRVVVRSTSRLPDELRNHPHLAVTEASLLDLSDAHIARFVEGCPGIASCLGHNLNLRGLFGAPRRLVTDAVARLCQAAKSHRVASTAGEAPVRFVLMNSAGVRSRNVGEKVSAAEAAVAGLLRLLVPPHADNEAAAQWLQTRIGSRDPALEWVAVRPDSLCDAETVGPYQVHRSPTRSAIFNSGTTARINVAHFMAELLTGEAAWQQWKGQMPVLYNDPPL